MQYICNTSMNNNNLMYYIWRCSFVGEGSHKSLQTMHEHHPMQLSHRQRNFRPFRLDRYKRCRELTLEVVTIEIYSLLNLVPRACDPWEGNEGSGIIRCRKPGILAKIELRIHFNGQSDSSLKRIIPEPSFPSQGSQARGTRLTPYCIMHPDLHGYTQPRPRPFIFNIQHFFT